MDNDPDRLGEKILALRAYARTKAAYEAHCERGSDAKDMPRLPLMGEVLRNELLAQREALAQQRAERESHG